MKYYIVHVHIIIDYYFLPFPTVSLPPATEHPGTERGSDEHVRSDTGYRRHDRQRVPESELC